jgi:choline transport protein
LSVSAFLAFTITTLAMQKTKQDSRVVWTTYTEVSGWPAGMQFLIALTAPVIAFCPIDGAIHLVEQVKDARKVVPRTIMAALTISFATSIVFILAMLYCISDFDAVLGSPSGFPLFEVWSQATSTTTVPIVFTSICIFLLPVGTIACTQVASMMTWSLARDKGLGLGQYLTKVNKTLNAPVWALLVNAGIMFLIGCLHLISTLGM